ncbi:MAG: tetratricopeptide repeat protein [Actinomycetota bacterium]|nr:tetratricopeptide repeat protein [Actinomycetota bacterium]
MSESRKPRDPRGRPPGQGRSGGASSGRADRGGGQAGRGRREPVRGGSPHGRDRDPRLNSKVDPKYPSAHLADDVVRELHDTARPGKGGILVQVFGEAAAAFAAEDFVETVRLGEQAKHMALRSSVARELLGLAYYRLAKWKEAARELSAFRRISGSTDQNPVIADSYRAMQRPDKALELCDEIDPRSAPPAILYEGSIVAAGALADQERLDDAIARLEKLDLNPEVAEEHHLRAWYTLADLLERRGRFTQAHDLFGAVAAADAGATDAPERAARLSNRG